MKLKTWMLVNTVVAGLFGLALVLVPGTLIATYGVTADAGVRYVGQQLGACFLGIAALCWFTKDAPASETLTAIFQGLFLLNGVAFVVSLVAQLNGVMNAVGWSSVVIYLLLGLGWTYFLRAKPAA
jgi:hypothetical protein